MNQEINNKSYIIMFPIHLLTFSKLVSRTLSLLFTFLFTGVFSFSQVQLRGPVVSEGQLIKVIPSLKDYKAPEGFVPAISRIRDRVVGINEDNEEVPKVQYSHKVLPDPVVQRGSTSPGPNNFSGGTITQNFAGMGYTNVAPADPNMCAGPNHVIQMINGSSGSYLKIWDRNGTQVLAQIYMTTLVGTAGYSGSGDPIAIYDPFADRYMLTEFARIGGSNINSLVVFVSQSPDPTAGWYVYKFTDVSFFPDYPHYGVWPNVLYASTNDFNSSGSAFLGSSVWAMNKSKMLAGDPTAELQRYRLQFYCAPVNISNGSAAPASTGTVGHFMYYNDNDFNPNPGALDSIGMMNFTPDFAVPANTTLTYAQALVTAPYKTQFCPGRNCIPSASGNGYDGLDDRIMNRVNYRNFGSYESMVLNYTVDANAGTGQPAKAGIRWYELRKSGAAWSIFQQSTYAPDNDWRWMGSININSKGQIALGFNKSGTTSYASVAFTGRNAADAANTMSVSEVNARAGTAYGTFANRWGDYNDVTVDRVNDSLFWMTAMYGNGGSAWATQVVQFKIGDCNAQNSGIAFTQSGAAGVPENQNITYTNTVNNTGCVPISNFLITDTIPANVSFVSATNGGTYNAGNRVVSWPVNLTAGQAGNYTFSVNINAGAYFATTTAINETIAGGGIPSGWAATIGTGPTNWVSSTLTSHSAPNALYAMDNANAITDFRVSTTSPVATGSTPPTLSFWHLYNCETGWDGGVVEMSPNGGATWIDMGPYMSTNGYSGGVGGTNPISGRAAFTGTSGGWIQTKLRMIPPGQNALFRFRMTSDDNTAYPAANPGWFVDDILLQNIAEVNMRTSYFNSTGTRLYYLDTFTTILPSTACTGQTLTAQPSSVSGCAGNNAVFSVAVTGTPPITFQWQESITGGNTWNNITNGGIYSGATSNTLTLTGIGLVMNSYQYRCVVNGCVAAVNSNAAVLTVYVPIVITAQPGNAVICADKSASFSISATGTTPSYQWQVSSNNNPFTNIVNGGVYSGATTNTLTVTAPPAALGGSQYRCVISGAAPCANVNSNTGLLVVNPLPTVVITASPYLKLLPGLRSTISATSVPAANIYTWSRNGNLLSNASAGVVSGLNTAALLVDVDGFGTYQVMVTDINGCINTSNTLNISDSVSGKLFIYPNPNGGQFQVRYDPSPGSLMATQINVFNATGQLILTKNYNLPIPYGRMDIDLKNEGPGVYWIELLDVNGQKLANGRAEVLK